MPKKIQSIIVLLVIAALLLPACAPLETPQPASASAGSQAANPQAQESAPSGEFSPSNKEAAAGAEEAARRVVEWNVGYAEKELQKPIPQSPFVSRAYVETGFFTVAFEEKVSRILDVPEEWGDPNYDPILNGIGFEFRFAYDVLEASETDATVVVHESMDDFQRDITLKLVKQGQAWKVDEILEASLATPEGVTQVFYDGYLFYQKRVGNPYQDGIYRTSEYLSQAFIEQVDRRRAGAQEKDFDRIVMASSYPPGVQIVAEKTEREGDQARVTVRRFTSGLEPDPLLVTLERNGSSWQIMGIDLQEGPQKPGEALQAFYDWYLGTIGDPALDTFRNPLVERAYRNTSFLAPEFVQQVDALGEGPEGFPYDPFLCAQAVPLTVTPAGTYLTYDVSGPEMKTSARVVVRTSFPGHWLTADLQQESKDGPWQITGIKCGNSAEGKVYAFFTWYLGCDETGFSCRPQTGGNPALSEGWITTDFARRIEAVRASFQDQETSGYDPVIIAQAFPSDFTTELLYKDEVQAVVLLNTRWGTEVEGRLVQVVTDGGWKINNVRIAQENTPQAVTETFFTWYLNYLKQEDRRETGYNLRPEEFLAPAFLAELGDPLVALAGDENPLLLTRKLPEKLEFGPASVEGETARVEVQRFGQSSAEPSPLTVMLNQVQGLWMIQGVQAGAQS